MKTLTRLAAVFVLAAVPSLAQDAPKEKAVDVTGTWESSTESPQGTLTSTATYQQEGETLAGTHVGQYGEFSITGTVKGTAIKYTLTAPQVTITYTGTVDGDTISGTADFGGMASGRWTVKRKK